ncbi:ABC transporter ATP-binding protein [Musicola keenii]|uniref:ABC transporter ATP-binding protein n=1 Tax=Musicola keenii TaxID=2884250 RepID=UPI0017843272|nr:ABC transporter ATP-binding protein [Musicola keenii]
MSRLEVVQARVGYGDVAVLRGISFDVQEGEFVTLLGPSGCGKTTLLRAIAGFVPLDDGAIRIGGRDMQGIAPEKRNTAMCFQSYALFPHLTVADNIAFGLRQRRVPSPQQRQRVAETALTVALTNHLEKLPAQLSGGQQQRVALARAMAVRPDVLLFDEPLSNLDARLREQLRLQIRALQRQYGFTAVYVTHDQAEALAMSDRVIVMDGGCVAQIGTPQEIYHQPVSRFVADFVGTANIMAGTITGRDAGAGLYQVQTPLGVLTVTSAQPPVSARPYLCWRPEAAGLLERRGGEPNVFALRIRCNTFLGSQTDVEGFPEAGGDVCFRVQLPGHRTLAENSICHFSLPPDQLRFLQEDAA